MIHRKSPCYNDGKPCENRSVTCHSTCSAYIEWSNENARIREENARKRITYNTLEEVRLNAVAKIKQGFKR